MDLSSTSSQTTTDLSDPAPGLLDLSVVIVNYNVREFLEQALRSVERASALLRSIPIERISPRENQAFVLLLSIALLNRFFVQRQFESPPSLKVTKIDGTQLASIKSCTP